MFIEIAGVAAKQSSAKRLQVGAAIVNDANQILALSYNGTPRGTDNACEGEDGLTKDVVIHAELNAIIQMARSNNSCELTTMFVTHSPCLRCAGLIKQSGIRQVLYRDQYRDQAGIDYLQQHGVHVEKVEL